MVSLLFAACSGGAKTGETQSAPAESSAAPAETMYKVVDIAQSMSNESQAFAAKMYEKHAAEYGIEITIWDAKADPATEAQLVTQAIAQGFNALIVNPNDISGIVPSLMEAKEAGLVVGLFSSDLAPENQQYRDFFCGANDLQAGLAAAETFKKQFPDGAKIVEIGGQSGHDAQIKRHDGFVEGLEGSNIELLETQNCGQWAANDAMDIMQDFIVKYGDEIDGIFCHWDNGATGIIQACTNAGVEIPFLVGVDGCRAGFDQVKAGTQAVSLAQNFETMACTEMELIKTVLGGGTVEPINYIVWETVSPETIDSLTYPEW
jgi:ribose transport system substrate-binding protein